MQITRWSDRQTFWPQIRWYCCRFVFLGLWPFHVLNCAAGPCRSLSGRPLVDPQTGGELLDAEDCRVKFIKLRFLAVGKDRCGTLSCLYLFMDRCHPDPVHILQVSWTPALVSTSLAGPCYIFFLIQFVYIHIIHIRYNLIQFVTCFLILTRLGAEDRWFTLDNRRLYCLQKVAVSLWPDRAVAQVCCLPLGPWLKKWGAGTRH